MTKNTEDCKESLRPPRLRDSFALRRNVATIAATIRTLTDEQLDRTAALPMIGGKTLGTQQLIETGMIGHIRGHVASMQTAVGAGATE
jgi:hypothetical protein